MRKLILIVMVSLDGKYAAPGEGLETIDFHHADDEWEQYSVEVLSNTGTLLFGRKTYQGFAAFWPEQEGDVARLLNTLPKVVFSTTLDEATWSGSRLLRGNVEDEIAKLKAEPGGDIIMFGSGDFAATLTQHGLIDEYRITVNPVVLGAGMPLFTDHTRRTELKLIGTHVFRIGTVELRYVPQTGEQS